MNSQSLSHACAILVGELRPVWLVGANSNLLVNSRICKHICNLMTPDSYFWLKHVETSNQVPFGISPSPWKRSLLVLPVGLRVMLIYVSSAVPNWYESPVPSGATCQNQNRPLACLDEEALKDITAPANLNSAMARYCVRALGVLFAVDCDIKIRAQQYGSMMF